MKTVVFFFAFFFVGVLFAQAPDTVYYEISNDKVVIVTETVFDNGSVSINKTEALDSATAVLYTGNIIHNNELSHVAGARILFKKAQLDAVYPDVNSVLLNISGSGYLPLAWNRYRSQYVGVWQLTNNQSEVLVYVQPNRTITQLDSAIVAQCDETGNPIAQADTSFILVQNDCIATGPNASNGSALYIKPKTPTTLGPGTFSAITQNSFLFEHFLPNNILPNGERLIRLVDNKPVFVGLNTNVVFTKLY